MGPTDPDDDSDALRTDADARRDDRFAQEIWPEAAMLLRTALSMTNNQAVAEDLVQDTMLKALRALDLLKPGSHPKAWLLTLLRNTWIDGWRKQSRRPESHAVSLDDAAEPQAKEQDAGQFDAHWQQPEELMSRINDQEVIDALQLIPEGYRWALLLVDVQSLRLEQAAEVLGVATGTIKSRLHRGRAMLRDRLHDYGQERGWLSPRSSATSEKQL